MKKAIEYLEKMLLIIEEDGVPPSRDWIGGYTEAINDLKIKEHENEIG